MYNFLIFPNFLILAVIHGLSFKDFNNLDQARRTESSLQKIRLGAQRRGGASSDTSDHVVSETDKVCMQLFLDIQVRVIFD